MPLSKAPQKASGNYRKPPAKYQFKKGLSGNPNGRPKKVVEPGAAALGGGAEDHLHAMVLDEANRFITVREGGKVSEMPAIQAVFRTMFRAAAEGDAKAGAKLLDMVGRAESGRATRAQDNYLAAFEYKLKHGPKFEESERAGRAPPNIYPHPDDVVINEETGEVTIDGPISEEDEGRRKFLRNVAERVMPGYLELKDAAASDPKNGTLREELETLQYFVDFLEKDKARDARREALRLFRDARAVGEPAGAKRTKKRGAG